jgi:cytochrome c oxidase subunit 2
VGKLFAVLVAAIALVSTALFAARIWWMPADISVLGAGIDHQLNETMIACGALFVVSQLTLAWFVWRGGDRGDGRPVRAFPGGATPLVVGAIVLVGIEILTLTFVGSKLWSSIYLAPPNPQALHIDVQAEQFAFYFRYAGKDNTFGGLHPDKIDDGSGNYFGLDPANDTTARDDIVSGSLVIPVNMPILLSLHAKDVGHSFYVPDLRIQQDFVPGLVIPLQFTATRVGKYEIVCTQLCGLGHYNMRAYLEVMSPTDYDAWMKTQAAQQ